MCMGASPPSMPRLAPIERERRGQSSEEYLRQFIENNEAMRRARRRELFWRWLPYGLVALLAILLLIQRNYIG